MFPDGFPLSPIDAIKFSSNFGSLTPQEEQDWYKWLETANPEQQKELVDTLHQIYASHHLNQPEQPQNFQNNPQFSQNQPNQFLNNSQNEQFQNNQNIRQNQQFQNSQVQNPQSNFQPNDFQNQNVSQNFQNNPQNNQQNPSDQFQLNNNQQSNFNQNSQNQNPNQSNFGQIPVNSQASFDKNNQAQKEFGEFNQFQNNQFNNDNLNLQNSGQNQQFQNQNSNRFDNNPQNQNSNQNFDQKESANYNSQVDFDNQPKADQNNSQSNFNQTSDNPYADNSKKDFTEQFEPKPENPSEESFLNLANSKYTPNPILEDKSPEPEEFAFSDEVENEKLKNAKKMEQTETSFVDFAKKNSSENFKNSSDDLDGNLDDNSSDDFVFEEAVPKIPEKEIVENPKKVKKWNKNDRKTEDKKVEKVQEIGENNFTNSDFSFAEENFSEISKPEKKAELVKKPMYSAPEKNDLEDLYKLYINSQKKNLEDDQEFKARQAILQDDAHQKQVIFWDKVMQVVSNYEQMADNVLLMNEQIIRQAKEIQVLKNSTQARSGASLQDQINSLRYDLERVIREFDDYRAENYRRQKDMSEQVAAATADTYKTDGMLQKLDLLANRLTRIETQR